MPGFNFMTPVQLSRLIATPEAPVLLDLRTEEDFALDPHLLPCSLRARHEEVRTLAERFGAAPFDIEGITCSHPGKMCSIDAFIDDFGLHTPALDRLALVVRAADTDRHDLAPQAAGLLALSAGLSRQSRDDLAQLDAGMALCDALYRWARDGVDEGHDWPAGRRE
ncbi:chromate resistance protein ChrB domain-containing protein [Frigidibacter sp. SD6-1]|uniref:chromate resistance protein ChrB domain-containing protein n=1 Tax=Frigidibacter sp. SD6-1 TaxID=3032581 RepID=UPI0024DF8E77|nr:chromate resistance protein ChrB domain-containing protein [Frigidibacter sp. SD6-1]